MDFRDISIVGQVAAKEASQILSAVNVESLPEALESWDAAFEHVYDKLLTEIEEKAAEKAVTSAFQGTQSVGNGGGAAIATNGSVRVKGKQYGPLPAWLEEAAAKVGVTEVWDNRDKAQGTNKPWFREANPPQGADAKPFWPPKGNG